MIDPDINDSHTVRFNDINKNISHNHLFTIDANNTLRTAVVFDYENNSSTLYLRVKAKQNKVGVFWEFFTLSLLNDPSDDFIPPLIIIKLAVLSLIKFYSAKQRIPSNCAYLDSRNEQNGTSRLYGKILNDGGSTISEKGFLISTNLQFLNYERIFE